MSDRPPGASPPGARGPTEPAPGAAPDTVPHPSTAPADPRGSPRANVSASSHGSAQSARRSLLVKGSALGVPVVAAVVLLVLSRAPSGSEALGPDSPSRWPLPATAGPRAAAPPRTHAASSTDPDPSHLAPGDGDGEDDESDDTPPSSAPDDTSPPDLRLNAELAPRAPVTSEPLEPIEIVVGGDLAPRTPVTSEPLEPIELVVDGDLSPRAPISSAPLVPRVLVDPPDPPPR